MTIHIEDLPKVCCMNVGRRGEGFVSCDQPAATWYQHGDSVCSFCAKHDYVCGVKIVFTKEEGRWLDYLASLDERVTKGEITDVQTRVLSHIWRQARSRLPHLRRPSAGCSDEGRLHLSWAFVDVKGITLTVDIERGGRVDWFYRNASTGEARGTEDEAEAELPEEAFSLLAAFSSRV